ncbi:MAG TPA: hypothetical protein DCZ93_10755 [Elusimicrobia bacterium]|nr:hypothetical protein [Elusimicrobiota bacterium]
MKAQKNVMILLVFLMPISQLSYGADISTLVLGAKRMALNPDVNTMSGGYYTAAILSDIERDLAPGNIKQGVTIFGTVGTMSSSASGLPDTGQTTVYLTGDDGEYNSGMPPKYTDNNDGTVTDNVTALMWIKDPSAAGMPGPYTWLNAIIACEDSTYAGYRDWRLPNINELQSIVNYQFQRPAIDVGYFMNTQAYYWSSTTSVFRPLCAWLVDFRYGSVVFSYYSTSPPTKSSNYFAIRCVRAGA